MAAIYESDEQEANARLIAAAPDLYAYLKRLEIGHPGTGGPVCWECRKWGGHKADCELAALLRRVEGE